MRKLSDKAMRLEGQKMFQILAKTKELERLGKEIIHFEIGDPDFNTLPNVADAACEAIRKGHTHYAPSAGIQEYKEVCAAVTERSRGFKPSLKQILVTAGANVQIFYAVACVANPGDEVIISDPSFVSYNSILRFLGVTPVKVPLYEKNQFRLNPDDVEKAVTDKTRMIIINSPHNPTGSVMTEDEIKKIYEIAEKHDLFLVSDEVYARMIYKDQETRFASPSKYDECKKRTIVVHSLSKSYAMTGWRIGAVTGPEELIGRMGLLLETTSSCVSPFIQEAAMSALAGNQKPIDHMMEEFRNRRDLIVVGLNSLPNVHCIVPKGAFYAFPNIKKTGLTSEQFTDLMLDKAGVAVCPGNYFGEQGEGYVRLCYANSRENIKKGIAKMGEVLANQR